MQTQAQNRPQDVRHQRKGVRTADVYHCPPSQPRVSPKGPDSRAPAVRRSASSLQKGLDLADDGGNLLVIREAFAGFLAVNKLVVHSHLERARHVGRRLGGKFDFGVVELAKLKELLLKGPAPG
jgi:hypothetical protein